jgi:hypothetical protein
MLGDSSGPVAAGRAFLTLFHAVILGIRLNSFPRTLRVSKIYGFGKAKNRTRGSSLRFRGIL